MTHRKARLLRSADLDADGYARLSYRQTDTLWKRYPPNWDLHQPRHTAYLMYTRTGKLRYYFGRPDPSQGEPVSETSTGYAISESVNGVASLAKDHLALIQPEEVETVEEAVQRPPRRAAIGSRVSSELHQASLLALLHRFEEPPEVSQMVFVR